MLKFWQFYYKWNQKPNGGRRKRLSFIFRSILLAMATLASAGPADSPCPDPYDCKMMTISDSYDPGIMKNIPVGATPSTSYFEEFKVDDNCIVSDPISSDACVKYTTWCRVDQANSLFFLTTSNPGFVIEKLVPSSGKDNMKISAQMTTPQANLDYKCKIKATVDLNPIELKESNEFDVQFIVPCPVTNNCMKTTISGPHTPAFNSIIPIGTTPFVSYFEEFKVDDPCDDGTICMSYKTMCRVANSGSDYVQTIQNPMFDITQITPSPGSKQNMQISTLMISLQVPTAYECIVQATVDLNPSVYLQSSEFDVTFSACVSPSSSCPKNTYTLNPSWKSPLTLAAFLDGSTYNTSFLYPIYIDKIQELCTTNGYPGVVWPNTWSSENICATPSYKLVKSGTDTDLTDIYSPFTPTCVYSFTQNSSPDNFVVSLTTTNASTPASTTVDIVTTFTSTAQAGTVAVVKHWSSFLITATDMCHPPACKYSQLISPATAPTNIEVDAGKPSPLSSFNSFKDSIQVGCNSVNHCGTSTYKLMLADGTYLPTTIATITQQSSDINLINVLSTLPNVGAYKVTIEGTMNTGTSISVANSPQFTITILACNSCAITELYNTGNTQPQDYNIGVDGVPGYTSFSSYTNTVEVACTTVPFTCGKLTFELLWLNAGSLVTVPFTTGVTNANNDSILDQFSSTLDYTLADTYNVMIQTTLDLTAYGAPPQIAQTNYFTVKINACSPLPCKTTTILKPDPDTLILPGTMSIKIDNAVYNENFSPYQDSVSLRCSGATYSNLCTSVCGDKQYQVIVSSSSNNYNLPPYTIQNVAGSLPTMKAVSIQTNNDDYIGVYHNYIKASFTKPECSSTDSSSQFQINVEPLNQCNPLDCTSNELYPYNATLGDVLPQNFTVEMTGMFSSMSFSDFRDGKSEICAKNKKHVCGEAVYQVISVITGLTIDRQFVAGNVQEGPSIILPFFQTLQVKTQDRSLYGVWEYFIRATLSYQGSIVSAINSNSFWITVTDQCKPWDCSKTVFSPPINGILPNNIVVKSYSDVQDSYQSKWINSVNELCYVFFPNEIYPICGEPLLTLVLADGSKVPFHYSFSYTATLLRVSVWIDDGSLAGRTFQVKVMGYQLNTIGAGFSSIFTVKIVESQQFVGNSPPQFSTFPPDFSFFVGQSPDPVEASATAIDSDGSVAQLKIELPSLIGQSFISYTVTNDQAKFIISPNADLPQNQVIVSITAIDNLGKTVTKSFTVSIVHQPPVLQIPQRKTPDIVALLTAKGLDHSLKQNDKQNLTAWINSIDELGRMEIWYNWPVIPVQNITLITTDDFHMVLKQNSDEVDQTADFRYQVTNSTPFKLFVQLDFSIPIDISQNFGIPDLVYVQMARNIFMVEDRWGLFKYWLDPNYKEPVSTITAANSTNLAIKSTERHTYNKTNGTDSLSVLQDVPRVLSIEVGLLRLEDFNNDLIFYPLNHSLPLMSPDINQYQRLKTLLKFEGSEITSNQWAPTIIQAVMFLGSEQIWIVLGTLQVINLFPLYNLNVPLNVKEVSQQFQQIAKLQFKQNKVIYDFFSAMAGDWNRTLVDESVQALIQMNSTDDSAIFTTSNLTLTQQIQLSLYKQYGASTRAIEGSAQIFGLVVFFGSFTVVAFIFQKAFLPLFPEKFRNIFDRLRRFLYWTHPFRFLIEQYMCSCFSCFINLRYNFGFTTTENKVNSSFVILWVVVYIIGFPLFSALWLHYNSYQLYKIVFKQQFEILYRSVDYFKKQALPWLSVQLARRMMLVLIIAWVDEILVQINIALYLQNFFLQYLFSVRPMMSTLNQLVQVFNEVCILILTMLMFTFTGYNRDNTARYQTGWIFICVIYINVVGNIVAIALRVTDRLKFYWKVLKVKLEIRRRSQIAKTHNQALNKVGGQSNKINPLLMFDPLVPRPNDSDMSNNIAEEIDQVLQVGTVQNFKRVQRGNRKQAFLQLMQNLADPVADKEKIALSTNAPLQNNEHDDDLWLNDVEINQNGSMVQKKTPKMQFVFNNLNENQARLQEGAADDWPVSPRQARQQNYKQEREEIKSSSSKNVSDSWGFDNEGASNHADQWGAIPEEQKVNYRNADEILNESSRDIFKSDRYHLGRQLKKKPQKKKKSHMQHPNDIELPFERRDIRQANLIDLDQEWNF